mmetsp:Transcript_14220/g.19767  ORF Transcript_14220/g.19767 Transcript_14220/m.19767 type:complete len:86 (-) Transcript_14220:3454-3711(-)
MPCFTVEPAKKLFRSVFKSRTNAILEDRLDAWAEDKLSEADLKSAWRFFALGPSLKDISEGKARTSLGMLRTGMLRMGVLRTGRG